MVGPGEPCQRLGYGTQICVDDGTVNVCEGALDDGLCTPLPGVGEPCSKGRCNRYEAWCGADDMCVAALAEGAPCSTEPEAVPCGFSLGCHAGECHSQPYPWPSMPACEG